MKVEVDVLGSPFLIVRTAPVDVKQHRTITHIERLRSRVEVEVDVLGTLRRYGLCGQKATLKKKNKRSDSPSERGPAQRRLRQRQK